MKSITVEQLQAWRQDGTPHTLVDIREPYERSVSHLDGIHIPMSEVMNRLGELPQEEPLVIHCRSGARSAAVTQALTLQHGMDNVHNLTGGIMAWASTIEPQMDVA